uniref:CDGSH iron-sulfur domain-containing protein 2 homologue n=1 Tax=Lygus hesperus TaxID=30085 RepID=A0A0A9Y920_LYGHE
MDLIFGKERLTIISPTCCLQVFLYFLPQSIEVNVCYLRWFVSVKDWANLVPFFALVGGAGYITYRAFRPKQVCNPCFKKDDPKVVNVVNIEELGEKTAFCRCWRSAKFPYCDGAHAAHNKETGDNVGPLLITKVK